MLYVISFYKIVIIITVRSTTLIIRPMAIIHGIIIIGRGIGSRGGGI